MTDNQRRRRYVFWITSAAVVTAYAISPLAVIFNQP